MKHYMKIIIGFTMFLQVCCTGGFDELNTDPSQLSKINAANVGNAFALTQYRGLYGDPGLYQLARNLFADYYCGYFAVRDPGIRSDRYVIVQDWIISQWNCIYTVTWPTLKQVLAATETTDPEANAIAKIWKVFVFHSNTDMYGPIPYSQAGNGETAIPYDSQQDIYNDFFVLLDEAQTVLNAADKSKHPFGDNDLIYQGDINQWIRFGNTLRLRLALRISASDPQKAQQEAEKAVAAGVMETNDDNGFMAVNANTVNGLNVISDWGESFVMSAAMESYLKGYQDPRMAAYFRPGTASGVYRGVRNGLSSAQMNSSPLHAAGAASNIGPGFDVSLQASNPLFVMYAAEAYFLRAEGALNGWNMGGTAKEFYEKGIAVSLQQWGITNADQINAYTQGTTTPIALDDYFDSPSVAAVRVKFATEGNTQRQQVATQKWLALYPEGLEAWAEVRRTGYPLLYPRLNSDNPDMPADELIRRIPYLDYEKQTNGVEAEKGVALLGGPDKPTTRLWWNP